jgi:hypothetical protein
VRKHAGITRRCTRRAGGVVNPICRLRVFYAVLHGACGLVLFGDHGVVVFFGVLRGSEVLLAFGISGDCCAAAGRLDGPGSRDRAR